MLLLIMLVLFLLITQCLPTTCFLFDPSGLWRYVEEHLDTPGRPAVCSTWCSRVEDLTLDGRQRQTDRHPHGRRQAIARRNLSIVESSESQRDSDSSSVIKRRRSDESFPPSSSCSSTAFTAFFLSHSHGSVTVSRHARQIVAVIIKPQLKLNSASCPSVCLLTGGELSRIISPTLPDSRQHPEPAEQTPGGIV